MKLDGRTAQRTLAWVNRIRVEQGRKPLKRLPRGKRYSFHSCPIARALEAGHVSGGRGAYRGLVQWRPREFVHTPEYVNDFIEAFDEGRIPELIK